MATGEGLSAEGYPGVQQDVIDGTTSQLYNAITAVERAIATDGDMARVEATLQRSDETRTPIGDTVADTVSAVQALLSSSVSADRDMMMLRLGGLVGAVSAEELMNAMSAPDDGVDIADYEDTLA